MSESHMEYSGISRKWYVTTPGPFSLIWWSMAAASIEHSNVRHACPVSNHERNKSNNGSWMCKVTRETSSDKNLEHQEQPMVEFRKHAYSGSSLCSFFECICVFSFVLSCSCSFIYFRGFSMDDIRVQICYCPISQWQWAGNRQPGSHVGNRRAGHLAPLNSHFF